MNNFSVLVYDSGIGGLNVLYALESNFPQFDYYYMSDSKNTPYGEKSEDWLYNRVLENLLKVNVVNFACVVFACNTISTTIKNKIERLFPKVKFYGVYPNLDNPFNEKTLLLCTSATAKSSFVGNFVKDKKNLIITPCDELVKFIEKNIFFSLNDVPKYFPYFSIKFTNLILGCTHFCFVKEKLIDFYGVKRCFNGKVGTENPKKGFVTLTHFFCKKLSRKGCVKFVFCDKKRNFVIYNKLRQKSANFQLYFDW